MEMPPEEEALIVTDSGIDAETGEMKKFRKS